MIIQVCFTLSLLFSELFTGFGILTLFLGISSEPPEFDVVSSGKGDGDETKEGEACEFEDEDGDGDEDGDEKGDRLRSLIRKSSFFCSGDLLMSTDFWAIFVCFAQLG